MMQQAKQEAAERLVPRKRTRRPLILIVDDVRDTREMYADLLSFNGFRVAQAADGHEALLRATALHPDAILMDIALPAIDGLSVTRRLKDSARTASIPVIAITGYSLEYYRDRAVAAGCEALLGKPCVPGHLIGLIQGLIDRSAE